MTPHLAVSVDAGARVPMEYVKNGEIVLNISFGATQGLKMDNDAVHFHARFGGISREIFVPVRNVIAIYAQENGQGMAFEMAETSNEDETPVMDVGPTLASVPSSKVEQEEATSNEHDPDPSAHPPRGSGKPFLTRIK